MADLNLTNVINISVSQAQLGINDYNVNNLALFTTETPGSAFGVLGYQIYLDPQAVADDFGTSSDTFAMANQVFSQQPNILAGGGYLSVIPYSQGSSSETLAAAITRTEGLVQYFGIISTETADDMGSTDMLAAAAVVQPLNKMVFFVSGSDASINPSGLLDLLRANGYTKSRGLYYSGSAADLQGFVSAYAGRALSTNFTGTNTTETMHLKNLTGVSADPNMTQTLLNLALAAGVDTYPSLQGVPKVFCSGENEFFDQVYNLGWFVGALQVAGFNYLAQSSTKIPQTEQGMTGLKGAYRNICQVAVQNQYLAPGSWNSSTTFGNQVDFLSNIADYGYYIFSQPVSQQSQTQREARIAPLVQIAVKEAGAIQKSNVIVYVNA